MVNDCAKPCQAKNVFAAKRNLSLNEAKKERKNFSVESLDQCRRLEVGEKARNIFCAEPTCLRPQGVTQHRIFVKFFSISLGFARFFSSYFGLQILVLKEFNKTIIPFALVGFETCYAPRWLFTISYPTRIHGIIVKYM